MACHAIERPVFMLRVDDTDGLTLGEDGQLPPALAAWVASYPRAHELTILTSTQPHTRTLAAAIAAAAGAAPAQDRSQLAPLDRALASDQQLSDDGLGGESPQLSFKKAFGERAADLVMRVEPLALEVEGATMPVLLLAHEGACRVLRAFLLPSTSRQSVSLRESVDNNVQIGRSSLLEFSASFTGGPMSEKVHVL